MTKEELEKEAKEYAEQCYGWTNNDLALDVAKATYITSTEQREKKIKSLGERCLQLQKDKGRLTDQLTKAKELLEKLLITSCNSDVLNLLPNCSEVLRVRVEAEQFLSEVEI